MGTYWHFYILTFSYLIYYVAMSAAGGENALSGYWAYKHGGTRKRVFGRNGESYHVGSSTNTGELINYQNHYPRFGHYYIQN